MSETASVFAPAPAWTAEILRPDWLSDALSKGGERVTVTAVRELERMGPTATKVRFEVDYADGKSGGMPARMCLKGHLDDPESSIYKSGTQISEARVYGEIAPELSIRTPECLYYGVDDAQPNAVVILEDLKRPDVRFLGALHPCTSDLVRGTLDQLARLHAESGKVGMLERHNWVKPMIGMLLNTPVRPDKMTELLQGPRGAGVPDDVLDGHRTHAALAALADLNAGLPQCIIHGDCHAGNFYDTPDGPGVLDWQVVQRGVWGVDVAYHISSVLPVEHRREAEQDLLRHYLDRVAVHGGHPPKWNEAWDLYRVSLAYGYFMWGMTLRVDPPIIKEFIYRIGHAISDHDTFGRLKV
jgi:hypothetical protein